MEFKDLLDGLTGDYSDATETASRIWALQRFILESKRRNAPIHPNDIIVIMGFKEKEADATNIDLMGLR